MPVESAPGKLLTLNSAFRLTALLGLVAAVLLALHHGIQDIRTLLRNAGWPLFWLVPLHALPLLLDAVSWRVLLAPRDCAGVARLPYLFWVAMVREAVSRLLLVSVGGELVGIRLLLQRGLDGVAATASVVIQLLLSVINQYLFALLGLGLILHQLGTMQLGGRIASGLLLSAPIPLLAFFGLRHGRVFERAHALLLRLIGKQLQTRIDLDGAALDAELRNHFGHPRLLLRAAIWEFAGLVLGALENWLALRLLGHPVSLVAALSLEAVTQAGRHLFFMVPAGLGVQEAALLLFGASLGIPPTTAIALSLTKRMREILFGVPALLGWQWLELGRPIGTRR